MEIELVNPAEDLIEDYKKEVKKAIEMNLITLDEWNMRFKFYRDDYGYSFIHYLNCIYFKIDTFLTDNPIMLENRKELEKRFGVKIISSKEFLEDREN